MAQAVRSGDQEYWRPPNRDVIPLLDRSGEPDTCRHCGTEYSGGARFCHFCGNERGPRQMSSPAENPNLTFWDFVDVTLIRERLKLPTGSFVFFVLGITCMLGAVLTGFIYKEDTLVDWQAVQIWRTEWLLGGAAALLAGILLKCNRH